jgi:hypothetical protein
VPHGTVPLSIILSTDIHLLIFHIYTFHTIIYA